MSKHVFDDWYFCYLRPSATAVDFKICRYSKWASRITVVAEPISGRTYVCNLHKSSVPPPLAPNDDISAQSPLAVAPEDGSYHEHNHRNSPPDIAAGTNANIPLSARKGKGPERVKERPSPSAASSRTGAGNGGNRAPLTRTSSGTSSGHALNAPPSSSPPEHGGEIAGPVGGGGGRGGREVFPGGGSRKRPYSSALGERGQYPDSIRQGGSRRASAPSLQTAARLDADQRRRHPQPDEQRSDRPRWAVVGSRARGHEDGQYQAGMGQPVQTIGATPPPPEGFFDRDGKQDRFLHGTPDGVFRGRRRTESQVPERAASRARNGQDQGGAGDSNAPPRAGLFRAPKIASLIRSSSWQQYDSPAHDAPPTRSPLLRGTPRQLEGGYFHHGGGDRQGLAHERERQQNRHPFRHGEEPTGTSSRSWHAAPPAWPVEEADSEAGARAAYGRARVSVPVAMTVDNHHIGRPRADSHQGEYRERGLNPRHVDTGSVFDRHRAGPPRGHPGTTKRFADKSRYPTGSNSINQRYVDSGDHDYSRPFGGNGNRALDTLSHAAEQAFYDDNNNNNNSRYVDSRSRQTPHRYSDVDTRSEKRGRWCQQGQEPEREQRFFQAGMPRYSPRLASGVTASNEIIENSGWARGKLDAYSSCGLTVQSPAH